MIMKISKTDTAIKSRSPLFLRSSSRVCQLQTLTPFAGCFYCTGASPKMGFWSYFANSPPPAPRETHHNGRLKLTQIMVTWRPPRARRCSGFTLDLSRIPSSLGFPVLVFCFLPWMHSAVPVCVRLVRTIIIRSGGSKKRVHQNYAAARTQKSTNP